MEFPETSQKPVAYQLPRQEVIERLLAYGLIVGGRSISRLSPFSMMDYRMRPLTPRLSTRFLTISPRPLCHGVALEIISWAANSMS
jgi:hypothetical protein